jgi:hypothetical protein
LDGRLYGRAGKIRGFSMYDTSDVSSEVEELTWAMVDDRATEGQIRRLERLLLEDREARRLYLTCMQIYATLECMFGGKRLGLPPAVKEAIKAQKKSAPPLSIVDLPATAASARHSS